MANFFLEKYLFYFSKDLFADVCLHDGYFSCRNISVNFGVFSLDADSWWLSCLFPWRIPFVHFSKGLLPFFGAVVTFFLREICLLFV